MIISFWISRQNNTQIRYFCPKLRNFCSFCSISTLDKAEGADFKNDNSVLKFSPKKHPNKSFFPEVRDFSFFCKILQLG